MGGRAKLDLSGTVYGRLTVLEFLTRKDRHSIFKCRCECGKFTEVRSNNLRTGHTKSCGCFEEESRSNTANKILKHGQTTSKTRSPTYQSWRCMRERCKYPSNYSYRSYGGRGVTYCARWEKFENFVMDMGLRPEGHTLDRINPFGNYEPENCRWLLHTLQHKNKRSNYGRAG